MYHVSCRFCVFHLVARKAKNSTACGQQIKRVRKFQASPPDGGSRGFCFRSSQRSANRGLRPDIHERHTVARGTCNRSPKIEFGSTPPTSKQTKWSLGRAVAHAAVAQSLKREDRRGKSPQPPSIVRPIRRLRVIQMHALSCRHGADKLPICAPELTWRGCDSRPVPARADTGRRDGGGGTEPVLRPQ